MSPHNINVLGSNLGSDSMEFASPPCLCGCLCGFPPHHQKRVCTVSSLVSVPDQGAVAAQELVSGCCPQTLIVKMGSIFFRLLSCIVKTKVTMSNLFTQSETDVYLDQTVNVFSFLFFLTFTDYFQMHSMTTFSKIHDLFSHSYSATCKTLYIWITSRTITTTHCFQNRFRTE